MTDHLESLTISVDVDVLAFLAAGDVAAHHGAAAADLLQAALPDDPERISSWPLYARLLPHAQAVLDAGSD
ncbi:MULTISPECIES: hypothetical protein [Streptosporangium]|uniref:Uncharacterized protein n=1 Tax=Streptosporangium brasiliense TaxID=47480 RepID=A0ABT9RB10_9ACTN|nr:hypothetical protein [Streptosporangium brasiliense]MDP9866441.1 hypothetical protein [Streptosporangium brasiliense]